MRSMKSSIYRYARRQAHRDFNRVYYSYSRSKNGNTTRNVNTGKNNHINTDLSDKDIILGTCVVIGLLFFILFVISCDL